jgi:hypothetical protein
MKRAKATVARNPTRPERNSNIDVQRITGLDPDHRDKADGNTHQHIKTEYPVRQSWPFDDAVDGDEERQTTAMASASVTA